MRHLQSFLGPIISVCLLPGIAHTDERIFVLENEGWELFATENDAGGEAVAIALLFHGAARDRSRYDHLAALLAETEIASIRMDLRGHGESTNIRTFDFSGFGVLAEDDPEVMANRAIIDDGDRDVAALQEWVGQQPDYQDLPLIVLGASYSGEEIAQAGATAGFGDLYVQLSPGSFSEESIAQIDSSGARWLFVRADIERSFFPPLFEDIGDASDAEIWVLEGEGHADRLLTSHPELLTRLRDWISARLRDSDVVRVSEPP